MKQERWRYVYARKFGKARLAKTFLYGPIKDGKPDFKKMARLVRKTTAFPIIQSFRDTYKDIDDRPSNDLENDLDIEIACKRLTDIEENPRLLIEGDVLDKRLADIGK